MNKKTSILDFSYPIKSDMGWYWETPNSVLGGWKSWIYKRWEHKTDYTVWRGKIIFGWKKIIVEYTCSPEIALREHEKGKTRLFHHFQDLVDEIKSEKQCCKSHSDTNEKCCQDKN